MLTSQFTDQLAHWKFVLIVLVMVVVILMMQGVARLAGWDRIPTPVPVTAEEPDLIITAHSSLL